MQVSISVLLARAVVGITSTPAQVWTMLSNSGPGGCAYVPDLFPFFEIERADFLSGGLAAAETDSKQKSHLPGPDPAALTWVAWPHQRASLLRRVAESTAWLSISSRDSKSWPRFGFSTVVREALTTT